MTKTCPRCAEENPLTTLRCRGCGLNLASDAQPMGQPAATGSSWAVFFVKATIVFALALGGIWLWHKVNWRRVGDFVQQHAWREAAGEVARPVSVELEPERAPEPDWQARSAFWSERFAHEFKTPPAGEWVEIPLSSGARATGTYVETTPDSVVVRKPEGTVAYAKTAIVPSEWPRYFVADYASGLAQQKVGEEQAVWQQQGVLPAATEGAPASVDGPAVGGLTNAGVGPLAVAPATMGEQKIKCYQCNGLGFYMGASPGHQERVPCPICGEKGGRTFRLPPNGALCTACSGMGKIVTGGDPLRAGRLTSNGGIKMESLSRTSSKSGVSSVSQAIICKVCRGDGFVVSKY